MKMTPLDVMDLDEIRKVILCDKTNFLRHG